MKKKTGSYNEMVEYKKSLPKEIFDIEDEYTSILIVPFDEEYLMSCITSFQIKPTDQKNYEICGDTTYCLRKIYWNGCSLIKG